MVRLGDTVILFGHEANGATQHPAIVTRVWNQNRVNLHAFPDASQPLSLTSVERATGTPTGFAYCWQERTQLPDL